ncbi:MAG: hypothetical protein MUE98_11450 [Rhodobacteraceae bacterium]|jgi:hypothetical protein|nr:hypothetical protein [Paracoccaceae bacterium]
MFDLDRLADFDRGLSRLAPPASGPARDRAGCPETVSDGIRLRCTMVDRLGVEPLCPFARVEAA